MDSYSTILRRWLKRRGLTARQAAPILGCAVSAAYEHLGGRRVPPATRVPAIAAVLGIGERKLRQAIARDRAALHGAHTDPSSAIATDDAGART